MNKTMVASRSMTYGTRRLKPGDEFTVARRDAALLNRIGRAAYAGDKPASQVDDEDAPRDDLAGLRKQYHDLFGKKPFAGWDAETLKAKIVAAKD